MPSRARTIQRASWDCETVQLPIGRANARSAARDLAFDDDAETLLFRRETFDAAPISEMRPIQRTPALDVDRVEPIDVSGFRVPRTWIVTAIVLALLALRVIPAAIAHVDAITSELVDR